MFSLIKQMTTIIANQKFKIFQLFLSSSLCCDIIFQNIIFEIEILKL